MAGNLPTTTRLQPWLHLATASLLTASSLQASKPHTLSLHTIATSSTFIWPTMPPKKQQAQGSSSKVKDDKVRPRPCAQRPVIAVLTRPDPADLRDEKRARPVPLPRRAARLTTAAAGRGDRLQKNKSAQVKKEVARIQTAQGLAGKSRLTLEKEKERELRAKQELEAQKRAKEEAALLRPVQTQKVPFGVDPKTVLCAFFKSGTCEKGNKCKFSHDLNVGRKVEKRNLYGEEEETDKALGAFGESHLATAVTDGGGVQTPWTPGTTRSYGASSSPRAATHEQQPTSVLLSLLITPLFIFTLLDRLQILHRSHRIPKVRLCLFLPSPR